MNSLKKPLNTGVKKVDSARALIARGWGVSLVSRCLRVSRAQLHVILRRTDDWKDGRRSRHSDDTDVLLRIHHVIGELPHMVIVGYGRCFADRPNLMVCLRSMPNVFTGSCARMRCCLSENPLYRHRNGHIRRVAVKESNSDGALTGSSSAVITEKNCESRSRWTAVTVRHCTGRSLGRLKVKQ